MFPVSCLADQSVYGSARVDLDNCTRIQSIQKTFEETGQGQGGRWHYALPYPAQRKPPPPDSLNLTGPCTFVFLVDHSSAGRSLRLAPSY